MKKSYLIPEVELIEVQQTSMIAESIGIVPGQADENGDDERSKEIIFEWTEE